MTSTKRYELAVIVPTRNENKYVGEMLRAVEKQVSSKFVSYVIVVTDGGSTDGTKEIVKTTAEHNKHILLISHEVHTLRGYDARDAIRKVDAKLYFYVDVDLAPSINCFRDMLSAQKKGCDVVLGSRYIASSSLERPPLRLFVSKSYNKLLNLFFSESITDHQCGFRLFNRRAADIIRRESREEHWMWDTEVVLLALRSKLRVCEIPIPWRERRSKRTPLRRLIGDIWLHGTGILRLFSRFSLGKDS